MKFSTLQKLKEEINNSKEYLSPLYQSGHNSGTTDSYKCPCCNSYINVDYVKRNGNSLNELNHTDNCLYLLINELTNVLDNEKIYDELDNIILDKEKYNDEIIYDYRDGELL